MIIDKEAAKNVKRMAELAMNGFGVTQIARMLAEEKVLTPKVPTEKVARVTIEEELKNVVEKERTIQTANRGLRNWIKLSCMSMKTVLVKKICDRFLQMSGSFESEQKN